MKSLFEQMGGTYTQIGDVIPRPLLTEAKNISGINRPGIYYLINESDDNTIAQIYIGQTRNVIARLDDHERF